MAKARTLSSCDCVAYSGSSRSRWSGYSGRAVASSPRSLSTRETRTLRVPKSTPATIAMGLVIRSERNKPLLSVCVHVPAQIARGCFVHNRGDARKVRSDVVFQSLLAHIVKKSLHPRHLHDASAAERLYRIIRKSSLASITTDYSLAIIDRKS